MLKTALNCCESYVAFAWLDGCSSILEKDSVVLKFSSAHSFSKVGEAGHHSIATNNYIS